MDKILLRATEVAEALGLSRAKTYELMASGKLPTVKIDGARRVPRAALEAWVKAETSPSEPDVKRGGNATTR
jgi:excisionase family DNA binding protein